MSELVAYARLGIGHILDAGAIDHLLFLLVLAAAYRLGEWRDALWVVTAFTVGHSVSLALAASGTLVLPSRTIEFLIPLTIVATGIENLAGVGTRPASGGPYRPVLAGVFGLVHGAGFANYLRGLFLDAITVPLLGFNIGIEIAQVLVLATAAFALALVDRVASHRIRVVAISTTVLVIAARMAVERSPWPR
jgi:HupE/UreJ protein